MEEDFTVEELKAALRKGVLANELNLVFVAPPTRTRAFRSCSTLSSTTCQPARR